MFAMKTMRKYKRALGNHIYFRISTRIYTKDLNMNFPENHNLKDYIKKLCL